VAELNHEQRIDRLERVVGILAEDQVALQKIVTEMATEMRSGFDRVSQQMTAMGATLNQMWLALDRMREADERIRAEMREADERIRAEMRERARDYDQRVDKLVAAIGEFLRRQEERRNQS
jgi:methyl-accepting chemotaxis protein